MQSQRTMIIGVLRYASIALMALVVNHPQAKSQTTEQPPSIQRHEWQVFTTANSDLPADWVLALAAGADGALWVGTEGGLARFHEGAWQVFTAANSDLPYDSVRALAAGADGALWVGTVKPLAMPQFDTGGELARFHEGTWQVFNVANSDMPRYSIWALAAGADGALWVGTSGGLARFHEGAWQVFTAANSDLPHDWVNALAADADGALWVGTRGGGLARFHEGAWQVFTAANSELQDDRVLALHTGADGALWVGTERGRAGPLP